MPQSPTIPSQKKPSIPSQKKPSSSRATSQKQKKRKLTDEGTSPSVATTSTSRPQIVFESVGPNSSRSHKRINPIAEKEDSCSFFIVHNKINYFMITCFNLPILSN